MFRYGAKSRNFVCKTSFLQTRGRTRFAFPEGVKAFEDDYAPTAEYPPLNLEDREMTMNQLKRKKEYLEWQESMKKKPTVEEKLMEFNIKRRYGWRCCILNEDKLDSDALPFHQFITRTQLVPNSMPEVYSSKDLTDKVRHFSEKLRNEIEDVVKFELFGFKKPAVPEETDAQRTIKNAQSMVNQISRTILQGLSEEEEALKNVQVDYKPKSEAFWLVRGFDKTLPERKRHEKEKKNGMKMKDEPHEHEPVQRNFQFVGSPLLQVRSEVPLLKFQNEKDVELNLQPVDCFHYNPAVYADFQTYRYATNIPGHWTGDEAKQNLISFHSSHFLDSPVPYNPPSEFNKLTTPTWISQSPSMLHAHGMLVSFSKLLAQAYTLGFNQFTDLDYPLTSQTVVTNGTDWSFYAYALNTINLHNIQGKSKQNMCWGLPAMKLLDESGKLNTEVLDWLLKFYLTTTLSPAVKVSMPYVKENTNDITDDIRREFIIHNFQDMYSQKRMSIPCYQIPEIYAWERIFKIRHKQRPMDARKREFEWPDMNLYTQEYQLKDPQKRSKRLKFMEAELAEKKEKEKIEQVRAAQSARFKTSDT